ncbi:rod-binding protein [Photobacterium halotolerans]|uniref:Flagellar protein n=1 Tax=Photobacterium halotolerans TaxID=265726 RepID=A0A7X4Y1I8_9GAMM|nr:rod-binding protein [Photobacterium halotolerans]NAW64732.1 flagellar protein [Photobacterium halotolerans]NAW86886.1 flagellar protein [Photobacterium halotolerans]NAX49227.1 flagellar protein [Photobacterium halotolerans]
MKIDGQANAMLYHDNSAVNNLKFQADKKQALHEVAGQFEAMFLQMVLRQMRSSSDALAAEDNPFSSKEQGVFRDFYDGQLAMDMAKRQSAGIADMLVKQLSPQDSSDSALSRDNLAANSPSLAPEAGKFNTASEQVALDKEQLPATQRVTAISNMAFQQPLITRIDAKMEHGS